MWVVCVWKVWFHKWAYVFYKRQRKYILSNKEKRYSFFNVWKCRWDWKRCCAFYHQRLNLSCKKFYRPKANLFCSKWRKSRVWHDSRVISSNRSQFSCNSQQHLLCGKTDLNVGGKTRNVSSLFNTFCSNAANRLHVFVAPYLLWVICFWRHRFVFFCALMGNRTKKLICFVYYHERQMFRSCKQHLIQTGSLFCKLQKKMKTLLVGTWR